MLIIYCTFGYCAQDAAQESERNADSSAQLKEVSQKLAESANTVRLLQEKLKEKESTINKVGCHVQRFSGV
jgi:septal ring factor EnvC (AmiA/AmiB activator)